MAMGVGVFFWAFFIFSVVKGLTGRGWAAAIYPASAPLPTPAHPERLHTTGSKAGRARCKADRPQQDAHRYTRQNAGRAAPVCTRYQTGHAGQIVPAAGSVPGKVYNFGRLFLSIFIWIYFAKSIDNPYIYGYNIISPDKCGLQPQYTKTGGLKMITLDFSQWAALWYVGGMASGFLLCLVWLNDREEQ